MPTKTGNGLETISLVITEEQAADLRELRDERRTATNRVSLSDVAREVIGAGLKALKSDTVSTTNVSEAA